MTRRTLAIGAAVLALALLVAGAVTAPRALRRIAFFRVREVEVVGARYIDDDSVVAGLRLAPDASTFDNLDPVRAAVRRIPGVVASSVERRLPGALRVTIREAVPVALAAAPDHLVLIDAHAHLLPFDPARVPTSLPVVDRDSVATLLLARLMLADPAGYALIESARIDHGDIVLDAGPHRVRLRPDADPDILRAVAAVRSYLDTGGVAWREIDARYHGRVFVRKGKA